MGKQDEELLTMGRIKRLLEPLSASARYRIASWVGSAVVDMEPATPVGPDSRQLPIPGVHPIPGASEFPE